MQDEINQPAAEALETAGTSRRNLLKAAGAVVGTALASVPISGFPQIMKRDFQGITLRHIGVSYAVQREIGEQASKDLGFKIEMQNLDTSASITRFVTQPNSVDIADMEGWQVKVAMQRQLLQGIDSKKIKEFDGILPIFTTGVYEGRKISRQGISPYEVMYTDGPKATKIIDGQQQWLTFLPQVFNADSLGYRPDKVGREVTEWKDLIDPKFSGRAAILDIPN
ncbi:MAG: putative transporter substrate-binding protein, partial [Rhodoferax sp.]|nr:putative transporter substrate-binding protein [Rhodoferax sp.]